jgi:hypothetical protein
VIGNAVHIMRIATRVRSIPPLRSRSEFVKRERQRWQNVSAYRRRIDLGSLHRKYALGLSPQSIPEAVLGTSMLRAARETPCHHLIAYAGEFARPTTASMNKT